MNYPNQAAAEPSMLTHLPRRLLFPCHHCARHIVAAGIARVVYVEPYPKSLATDLHRDAIDMEPEGVAADKVGFEPFVGVAPRQYSRVFSMLPRKDKQGNVVPWDGTAAVPRFSRDPASYLNAEGVHSKELDDRLTEIGLSSIKEAEGD